MCHQEAYTFGAKENRLPSAMTVDQGKSRMCPLEEAREMVMNLRAEVEAMRLAATARDRASSHVRGATQGADDGEEVESRNTCAQGVQLFHV